MLKLHKQLIDTRGISESSATLYIRNLYSLNNERPFDNLAWTKNVDNINIRLSEYAESTQKNMITSLVCVLDLLKDKSTYKKIYTYWYTEMMERNQNKGEPNKKSEKQEANWVSWDIVKGHEKRLLDDIMKYNSLKELTPVQYENILSLLILSLYTLTPPRRNQDYQYMMVVKKSKDMNDDKVNYVILDESKFVFNKYKTFKTYGQQVFDVPSELMNIIKLYLKHSPVYKEKAKNPVWLLVDYHEKPLQAVNSITRILNHIFGKKVGATMLRHIYLTNKYSIEDMTKDSEMMSHGIDTQRQYLLKGEGHQEVEVPEV